MSPKAETKRNDVLRRTPKTPLVPLALKNEKAWPKTPEELDKELKKNPNLLDDLARDLGQSGSAKD